MSPLYSLQVQDSELKDAISRTTDPLFLSLLKEKRLQLSRRICAEMSKVSLARDKQYRSFHNTNSAPIRCGLASPTAPAEMEKATPYWDKEAKKAGTKRNRYPRRSSLLRVLTRKVHTTWGLALGRLRLLLDISGKFR